MKKQLLFILLLILPLSLTAQSKKDLRDIDEFIEQIRSDWQVPAVGIGIVKGNEVVYTKGYGMADLESGRAANENTLFAIGSSTKAMTATAVLQLVDDELVELDEPVVNYLPEFRMYDDYATQNLTVRDLLCHRSGLPRHDVVWYGAPDSREELFSKLKYLEPSAGFREAFQYQNLMFMTAGYLVGQTRMSTWEQETQNRILTPLNMDRASMSVETMKQDGNHALPYILIEEDVQPIDFRNIDAIGPAGSVNASAREMSNWLIANINGGEFDGQSIISSGVLAQAHNANMIVPDGWSVPLAFDNGGAPTSYGLGWFISNHKGHKMVAHGGNIDGFSAMVAFLPQDSIGVVVLTNLNGNPAPNMIRNYIFDKMLEEEVRDWNTEMLTRRDEQRQRQDSVDTEEEDLKRVTGTIPSHDLDDYSGTYLHPAYGMVKVMAENDSLSIDYNAIQLRTGHYHYDVFAGDHPLFGSMKMAFHTDVDGNISEMSVKLEPSVDAIRFDRQPEKIEMTEEELAAFTGEYLIQGVQKVTVGQKEGMLTLVVPGQPSYTLTPLGDMKFNLEELDGFSALFQKGADGTIKTLVLLQPNGQFKGERIIE